MRKSTILNQEKLLCLLKHKSMQIDKTLKIDGAADG